MLDQKRDLEQLMDDIKNELMLKYKKVAEANEENFKEKELF